MLWWLLIVLIVSEKQSNKFYFFTQKYYISSYINVFKYLCSPLHFLATTYILVIPIINTNFDLLYFKLLHSNFFSKKRLKVSKKCVILIPPTIQWNCLHCSKSYSLLIYTFRYNQKEVFSCFLSALSHINY